VLGDFCARYDFTRRADQMGKKTKFFRRQIKRHAGTNALLSLQVELQIVDAETIFVFRRDAPAAARHPGKQLGKRERLTR